MSGTGPLLPLWAGLAGLALWAPAVTLPGLALPLQPMDGLVLAGWPLLILSLGRLPPGMASGLVPVLGPGLLSIALSWAMNGGSPLVLGWSLGFALPFVLLVALVAASAGARRWLLTGFLLGAAGSALLFLAQILRGAETLDFRNNPAFRLPPQYGRGFALMPEVSTFAVHGLIALGVVLVLWRHAKQGACPPLSPRLLAGLGTMLLVALLFTRSSSMLVLMPLLVSLSLAPGVAPAPGVAGLPRGPQGGRSRLLPALVITTLLALVLAGFVQLFFAERLASASAERSAAMRLASVLGGLSPLHQGELFGVGIGENAAVRLRAHEAARALGLRFGTLPEGVNSQLVGRLFEEGWPALLHLTLAAALLLRGWRRHRRTGGPDPVAGALWMLAWGSLLAALLVVGYRGIYTTWIWLGLTAGLGVDVSIGRGVNPRGLPGAGQGMRAPGPATRPPLWPGHPAP
ncbi:hypothetical protein BV394_16070 (plasmid) [Brevirhabdus pacifica]|uniref:Uncharacterized protein n=3 Tax=Brevirhabdus pacifica TaxID=1267768 RepID=A0A1P8QYG1_9RHOB|nr:hypothetical protein [Brevirhabdus pacifica]APX91406.1 hypothetical protein BV394_16070 [Brevirhabdus pacifica]PJJ78958.1 hypothetical protein CLV77_3117 [Brevirhabdus pacifica]